MEKGKIKNTPPLLGRYRLLKEKRSGPAYRSFLAFDLKLKRGVIVKLIPVIDFQKKHLPILWKFLEKTSRDEEHVSRVVELDFQKDSLLVVEEYLEGRYFNSQIFENSHEYDRFETILYRCIDLINRIHSRGAPHGFLDFRNIKLTQSDGIVLEDYPILYWLELNRLLPSKSTSDDDADPDIRDIRQLGLVLFNVYRTQLVPEFHAFPSKYSREELLGFFQKNSFNQFSDIERILAKLLLGGEISKGYSSIKEAYRETREVIGNVPPAVQVRQKFSSLGRKEIKSQVTQTTKVGEPAIKPQDFAAKLGTPVSTPVELVKAKTQDTYETFDDTRTRPEIFSRKELNKEGIIFRAVVWVSIVISLGVMVSMLLVITKGYLASTIPEITIPNFVRMSFKEAEKKAIKIGLKMEISGEDYSEELPRDLVIDHQPPEGARTKRGRTVYAVVSKGLADVIVPNVIDLPESAAFDLLGSFQLSSGTKEYVFNEDIPLGTIMDQSPPANMKVATGEKVDLIISAGLLKNKIPMPSLERMTLSEALNILDQKKLRVRKIIREYSDFFERDAVQYQNPAEGEEVQYGMMVDLEVMVPKKFMPMERFQVAITVSLPDYEGSKRVKITDKNRSSDRIIYNELHKGREVISLLAEGYGQTRLKVFLGNKLIREEVF